MIAFAMSFFCIEYFFLMVLTFWLIVNIYSLSEYYFVKTWQVLLLTYNKTLFVTKCFLDNVYSSI